MRDHKVGSTIRRGVSRRTVLAAGGAALASGTISGFPFVNSVARASGAPLTFWQFYAPGGPVPSQVEWFERTIAGPAGTTVPAWVDSLIGPQA